MLQQLKKYIKAANRVAIFAGMSAAILMGAQAQAVTPSPQMIEQFKQLPKAEQQRLARQYGIDPSMISGSQAQPQIANPQVVSERDMQSERSDATTDKKRKGRIRFLCGFFQPQASSFWL